jgi:hypothetical protein
VQPEPNPNFCSKAGHPASEGGGGACGWLEIRIHPTKLLPITTCQCKYWITSNRLCRFYFEKHFSSLPRYWSCHWECPCVCLCPHPQPSNLSASQCFYSNVPLYHQAQIIPHHFSPGPLPVSELPAHECWLPENTTKTTWPETKLSLFIAHCSGGGSVCSIGSSPVGGRPGWAVYEVLNSS